MPKANASQATRKARPPSGVIAPSQVVPVSASSSAKEEIS